MADADYPVLDWSVGRVLGPRTPESVRQMIRWYASQAAEAEKAAVKARRHADAALQVVHDDTAWFYGVDPEALVVGQWECFESVLRTCVYDQDSDPSLDQCLVCGEPLVRK